MFWGINNNTSLRLTRYIVFFDKVNRNSKDKWDAEELLKFTSHFDNV